MRLCACWQLHIKIATIKAEKSMDTTKIPFEAFIQNEKMPEPSLAKKTPRQLYEEAMVIYRQEKYESADFSSQKNSVLDVKSGILRYFCGIY